MTSKAKTLAGTVSTGGVLATGEVSASQVTGTLPIANGGTGLSTLGTAGQVLAVNSGATALEYADVDFSITSTFIAEGAVTDAGKVIQLLNNGKAQQVAGITFSAGTSQDLVASNSGIGGFDVSPSGNVIMAFSDSTNSNRLTVIVGAISGNAITFGTKVLVAGETGFPLTPRVKFVTNDKFVILYTIPAAMTSYTIVGDVSGTTATTGSRQTAFTSPGGNFEPNGRMAFDSNLNVLVLVSNEEQSSMTYGLYVQQATVSGTTLTYVGSKQTIESSGSPQFDVQYHSFLQKIIVAHSYSSSAGVRVRVLTPSATTSISIGAAAERVQSGTVRPSLATSTVDGKTFLIYVTTSTVYYVMTSVTGTTVTYLSTSASFSFSNAPALALYDPTQAAYFMVYSTASNAPGRIAPVSFNPSTGAVLKGTDFIYNSNNILIFPEIVYSTFHNRVLTAHNAQALSNVYQAQVLQPEFSNLQLSARVVGIAANATSDGGDVEVFTLGAVADNQSGLTINANYYVNKVGDLVTSATDAILVGKAIASDKLLVRNEG
jgi:hypothetical protein